MFNITTSNIDNLISLVPEGRLDTINSESFGAALHPLLESESYLIIDFSKCNYLASSGIRLLIAATKKLTAKGGVLFISSLVPEVFMVLEMAGLHSVLQIVKSEEIARKKILMLRNEMVRSFEYNRAGASYIVDSLKSSSRAALLWDKPDMVGYNELIIASGIGSPAESSQEDLENRGIFVLIGNCGGFIPFDSKRPSDFRVVKEAPAGAIYIDRAFSFKGEASCRLRLKSPSSVTMTSLKDAISHLTNKECSEKLRVVAIADFNPSSPSVSLVFKTESVETGIFPATIFGAKFLLSEISKLDIDESFLQFAARNLTIDNIITVTPTDVASLVHDAAIWLFNSDKWENPEEHRVKINTIGKLDLAPFKKHLARRLYSDSASVVIKMLHGGYSAETFQVDSFDSEGRKMRPTVLKIAGRDIILREAERCQKYSLPYIMNNSAMVLGTACFCDMGALRYNFVGIGGEGAKLEWLTNYYNTWPVEKLEPLFDKIFMQILKPWYGQPVSQKMYQYKDQDPRETFFSGLCETAEEILDISADSKYITIDGIDRKQINPYWFLKYEYKRRENSYIDYFTTVCHGDLNMQNILLDKEMNVYLIDFSETRPRAVVSDFARLESIFMVESAIVDTPDNLKKMVEFSSAFYNHVELDKAPVAVWKGEIPEIVRRNIRLSLKMREYANHSVPGNNDIVPYYIAMLEWTLPIICYGSADLNHKKLSAYIAGKLCEKIMEQDR